MENGILIVLIFVFIFFIASIIIASIALVKSNNATNQQLNISKIVFPNYFPLSTSTPQIVYGSLTIPLYTRDFKDDFNVLLNSPGQGFCQWPSSDGTFVCNDPQPDNGTTFRLFRLPLPPVNSSSTLISSQNLIQNGTFLDINPPLADDKSTTFKDSIIQSWTANDSTVSINGKDFGASGSSPYPYVLLATTQIISQTFQVTDACGYKCTLMMNAKKDFGGSAVFRIIDTTGQIRNETTLSLNTSKPTSLAFDWTLKTMTFFLNPGSYTLQISGESQTSDQQSAFTDISITPYLFNQFTIELPIQYKTVPLVQCTLTSDKTKHTSDFMKSVFVQQYNQACILECAYANYFTSSVSITNPSFFNIEISGPWKNLENVCAVELTLNWIAIGVIK